jgi:hypothetical protein
MICFNQTHVYTHMLFHTLYKVLLKSDAIQKTLRFVGFLLLIFLDFRDTCLFWFYLCTFCVWGPNIASVTVSFIVGGRRHNRGHRGPDRTVVGFTATYAVSAYH